MVQIVRCRLIDKKTMKSADELGYYAAQYERSVQHRAVDTDTGSLSTTNHHSQSSRSPSDASLLVLTSVCILMLHALRLTLIT